MAALGTIRRVIDRIVHRVCILVYLEEKDCGDIQPSATPQIDIIEATSDDFAGCCPFPSGNEQEKYLASVSSRLKRGQFALAAKSNDRLIGHIWLYRSSDVLITEVDRRIEFEGEGEKLILTAAWTHPDFRGQGVYSSLLFHIIQQYSQIPKVVYCNADNTSSRIAIEKFFNQSMAICTTTVFGIRKSSTTHFDR